MSDLERKIHTTPIAVIGLGATFAQAKNLEEFWQNILSAKDCITDVPADRWKIEDYYDADPTSPDKTYCKRGGFIPDLDFNPMEFGLPPNILEVTDVAQLLGLIIARDTLKDAGYSADSQKFNQKVRERTGVVLGVGGGQKLITPLVSRLQYPVWKKVLKASGLTDEEIEKIVEKMKLAYIPWEENSFPGMLGNVIAGRIANRFDFGSINSVVDAACAASLSAVQMAVSELVTHKADMMLTGGVDADNSPFMFMSFSKTPAFSESGNISPYGADSDGMLIGEGIGMLLLKRLEDAERDGDKIYAVIKGIGASSDGKYKSIYAPRSSGQVLAMQRAYEEAGYAPHEIDLIEGHGTGTKVGDVTEFDSMRTVFSVNNAEKQHIGIGSVKSQVGHAKAAAGAAGMVKAALALYHKILPPSINAKHANPKFEIEKTPFYVNSQIRPWIRKKHPRRASVSAFGFGGINVHIAMEEYQPEHSQAYRMHQNHYSILLQNADTQTLMQGLAKEIENLKSENAEQHFYHLLRNSEQPVLAHHARIGFVAKSQENCLELLQESLFLLQKNTNQDFFDNILKGIYYRSHSLPTTAKVVALFAGQGSQYTHMGKELGTDYPPIREAFRLMDEEFLKEGLKPVSETVYPIPVSDEQGVKNQEVELTKTQNAQPAIGALSVGMFKLLQQLGLKTDFVAGHSFGEITALWAAGALTDADYFSLAKARGQAMMPNGTDSGTMLAVKGEAQTVAQHIAGIQNVAIANYNSTSQVVLGGTTPAIRQAQESLQQAGFQVVPISVSAAFHTPLMQAAQQKFAQTILQTNFQTPRTAVFSNTTAEIYPADVPNIKNILQHHILYPVRFREQIENIYKSGGYIFVEFGPKAVLTNLVGDILKNQAHIAIALNASPKKDSVAQIKEGMIRLRVAGVSLQGNDPYQIFQLREKINTKFAVKLNGGNYVSEATKQKFEKTLQDGFVINKPVVTPSSISTNGIAKMPENGTAKNLENQAVTTTVKAVDVDTTPILNYIYPDNTDMALSSMQDQLLKQLDSRFQMLQEFQQQQLQVFQQFLLQQSQTVQAFVQLVGHEIQVLKGLPSAEPVGFLPSSEPVVALKSAENKIVTAQPQEMAQPVVNFTQNGFNTNSNFNNFSNFQTESKPVEQTFVAQTPVAKVTQPVVSAQTASSLPVSSQTTATVSAQSATNTDPRVQNSILSIVAEKTGYPSEMLELSMDMEADLGIDSIKRVEIFGAVTEQNPDVQGVNPQEMGELRTLGEVVSYVTSKMKGAMSSVAQTVKSAIATATQTVQNVTNTSSLSVSSQTTQTASVPSATTSTDPRIQNSILAIVAEKTGYPAEMLELSMDMEADLGIDSIKRVEIFGAVTEQNPDVQGVNPQEMGELRTLGEVVNYVQSKMGSEKKKIA